MYIIKPHIFHKLNEIIFGFSTKIGKNSKPPFFFNLSYSVGDDKEIVNKNRKIFFESLGLQLNDVAYQEQTHSDIIKVIECGGNNGESDSLITNITNLGLAVSAADCTPIFIYDFRNRVIAAVHSGWRGTEKKILLKTLIKLNQKYNSNAIDLTAYIGPSISQANYQVGKEVAEKFDGKYVMLKNGKLFLDVSRTNYDILIEFGIPENQIQKSELCTYEFNSLLHSYRRDGEKSGRSLGVIAIKG